MRFGASRLLLLQPLQTRVRKFLMLQMRIPMHNTLEKAQYGHQCAFSGVAFLVITCLALTLIVHDHHWQGRRSVNAIGQVMNGCGPESVTKRFYGFNMIRL